MPRQYTQRTPEEKYGIVQYEYDNKGNITNISSNDINISNTYDQYNNLTEQIIESNNLFSQIIILIIGIRNIII